MTRAWWTDGSMVNEGAAGDEGFIGDAATPDDAERIVDAHNTRGLSGLNAAWVEAEAALPEGWWIHALYAWSFDDMAYRAEAASPGRQIDMSHSASTKRHGTKRFVSGPSAEAYGPTPAAALYALAARLRAATPASGEPARVVEEK